MILQLLLTTYMLAFSLIPFFIIPIFAVEQTEEIVGYLLIDKCSPPEPPYDSDCFHDDIYLYTNHEKNNRGDFRLILDFDDKILEEYSHEFNETQVRIIGIVDEIDSDIILIKSIFPALSTNTKLSDLESDVANPSLPHNKIYCPVEPIKFFSEYFSWIDNRPDLSDNKSSYYLEHINSYLDYCQLEGFDIPPPTKLLKVGMRIKDIPCSKDLILIQKSSRDSIACVKDSTAEKLSQHGWVKRSITLLIENDYPIVLKYVNARDGDERAINAAVDIMIFLENEYRKLAKPSFSDDQYESMEYDLIVDMKHPDESDLIPFRSIADAKILEKNGMETFEIVGKYDPTAGEVLDTDFYKHGYYIPDKIKKILLEKAVEDKVVQKFLFSGGKHEPTIWYRDATDVNNLKFEIVGGMIKTERENCSFLTKDRPVFQVRYDWGHGIPEDPNLDLFFDAETYEKLATQWSNYITSC